MPRPDPRSGRRRVAPADSPGSRCFTARFYPGKRRHGGAESALCVRRGPGPKRQLFHSDLAPVRVRDRLHDVPGGACPGGSKIRISGAFLSLVRQLRHLHQPLLDLHGRLLRLSSGQKTVSHVYRGGESRRIDRRLCGGCRSRSPRRGRRASVGLGREFCAGRFLVALPSRRTAALGASRNRGVRRNFLGRHAQFRSILEELAAG